MDDQALSEGAQTPHAEWPGEAPMTFFSQDDSELAIRLSPG